MIIFLAVPVKAGEIWAADSADAFEVSTNFEDGLSKEDCEFMNEMKQMRYEDLYTYDIVV